MRKKNKWRNRISSLNDAVSRFPLTTIFIVIFAAVNTYTIQAETDMNNLLLALLVGVFLSAVSQVGHERFATNKTNLGLGYGLMGAVILLTVGYYFLIEQATSLNSEVEIKTFVALFALFIAFIWVPVIKSQVTFNQSFMIAFKALFISLFFSAVIFIGLSAIIGATDLLITSVHYKVFSHSANIVFAIFFPMYFLSLIPIYLKKSDGEKDLEEKLKNIQEKASVPKLLEALFSYIIIPLLSVYTLILILYIVQNLTGSFWEDNLLEPLLVSYAITVIMVYILTSELENKFVIPFRKFFPKVLLPIVLFQMVASFLTVNSEGMTHTRYYVLLFGLFAIASGLLFSIASVKKNGLIAPILLALAFLSILPPIDAFTVSKNSQIDRLEEALEKNDMIENGTIVPAKTISDTDKNTIKTAVEYLSNMNYTDDLSYIPSNFSVYDHFHTTFGFELHEYGDKGDSYLFLHVDEKTAIPIEGHDFFVHKDIYAEKDQVQLEKNEKAYTLTTNVDEILLINDKNEEVLKYEFEKILDELLVYQAHQAMTAEEATFVIENEQAKITIFVHDIGVNLQNKVEPRIESMTAYIFIQLK